LPNESWRYYRDNRLERIKKRIEKKRKGGSTEGKEGRMRG